MREHDFIYIVEGDWKIGQEEEVYHVKANDVLILEAGKKHFGIEPCMAGTKTYYIHALALRTDREDADTEKLCLTSKINAAGQPMVRTLFEKIAYASNCGDKTMASAYFDALLYEMRSISRADPSQNKRDIAEQIREMIIFSTDMITNEQIAQQLHISKKSAEKLFKRHFGTTIHRYQLEIKTENARTLLVSFPDMRLSDIASNLGFYDEFHFSKIFKAFTAMSPSAYREQMVV